MAPKLKAFVGRTAAAIEYGVIAAGLSLAIIVVVNGLTELTSRPVRFRRTEIKRKKAGATVTERAGAHRSRGAKSPFCDEETDNPLLADGNLDKAQDMLPKLSSTTTD